jgi:hypothetical protein
MLLIIENLCSDAVIVHYSAQIAPVGVISAGAPAASTQPTGKQVNTTVYRLFLSAACVCFALAIQVGFTPPISNYSLYQ